MANKPLFPNLNGAHGAHATEPVPDDPESAQTRPAFLSVPSNAVLPIRLETIVSVNAAVATAKAMLDAAEQNRRVNAPLFTTDAHPVADADWGVAGLIIEQAAMQLNEAIPNGQSLRTQFAFGALKLGVALLERSLAERGVTPSLITLVASAPAAEGSDATTS